jgi:magnesium transporter
MYYVGFSSAVIVASLILFQGFNTTDGMNTVSLLLGFIVTFLGVHLLNLSRIPEPPPLSPENPHHTALETGLMHPRMSISGRMSTDAWPMSAGPYTPTHAHRGSLGNIQHPDHRHRSVSSYSGEEGLQLERLREEEVDEDTDERTVLTHSNGMDWHSRAGLRHASPPPPSQGGDSRTPPRL